MPRDPSGTYTAPTNSFNPAVDATTIDPADWNTILADLSSAMTDSLSRTADGGMEDNLDMDGHAIINATINTAGPNTLQVDSVTLDRGQYPGTDTNDNATAGNVGEYVESVIAAGSAVSLVSSTAKTITSISLGAGDWDVTGAVSFAPNAATSITALSGSISLVDNTNDATYTWSDRFGAVVPAANVGGFAITKRRLSLNGTTTVYLVGASVFSINTNAGFGIISARRVR